eukprot:Nitzschia sp. Nitz4//scaffold120_size68122//29785//31020//NITZ4_006044-RA/size68122-processed-gene-0.45-mRNA-1//-1//CDS//3329534278//8744//frame0
METVTPSSASEGDGDDDSNDVLSLDSSNEALGQEEGSVNSIDVSEDTINRTCTTDACVVLDAEHIARAFPDKKDKSNWIIHGRPSDISIPRSHRFSFVAGIILVKNYKAASSTSAGIALRLNDIYGDGTRKWVNFDHIQGYKFAGRRRDRSIMFTSVRDPASRSLSRIFYTEISRVGRNPRNDVILEALQSTDNQYGAISHEGGGFQVRFLSMNESLSPSWSERFPTHVLDPENVRQNVRDIIHEYDFILVAERMDESLVAFALLLGLRLGDVLVNEAKNNAGGISYVYFHVGRKETCKRSIASFRSRTVKKYLESDEWRAQNYGDYLLHAAANRSLDLTIDRLGRSDFERSLAEFRALKQQIHAYCENRFVPPCAKDGTLQVQNASCYTKDFGCGYPCVDEYLESNTATT